MKDRKIGDIFEYPERGMLTVAEEMFPNSCDGCVFVGEHCRNDLDKRHTGECSAVERMDCMGVIFVETEKGGTDNG